MGEETRATISKSVINAFSSKYDIQGVIGHGGTATVYRAYHKALHTIQALKVLSDNYSYKEYIDRFQDEASKLANLNHPNIVKIFDVEEFSGHHYIAMELLEGQTLYDKIQKDGPIIEDIPKYIFPVLDALEYVHSTDTIHRDLKCNNIMLPNDKPVLMDFGIARKKGDPRSDHTIMGAIIGTPEYMSPEQLPEKFRSKKLKKVEAGPRSDVYSIGVVLYEMATGKPPFSSNDPFEVITRIVKEKPENPVNLNPAVPAELAAIILKSLEKDPNDRYQSCSELAEAISQLTPVEEQPKPVPPESRKITTVNIPIKSEKRLKPIIITSVSAILLIAVVLALVFGGILNRFFGIYPYSSGILAELEMIKRKVGVKYIDDDFSENNYWVLDRNSSRLDKGKLLLRNQDDQTSYWLPVLERHSDFAASFTFTLGENSQTSRIGFFFHMNRNWQDGTAVFFSNSDIVAIYQRIGSDLKPIIFEQFNPAYLDQAGENLAEFLISASSVTVYLNSQKICKTEIESEYGQLMGFAVLGENTSYMVDDLNVNGLKTDY